MANIEDVKNDPNYIQVHEFGFVGLVDIMGDDSSITQAARVSYGQGTKSVSDERALIRYLMRHRHTSPFEMVEVKFHIKLPIFVMRQLVRHRTANLNEYSGRYSVMCDEFYVPTADYLMPQSTTNKQGRSGALFPEEKGIITNLISDTQKMCYDIYKRLIEEGSIGENYPGLARELGRIILPVSNYTECYWKIDLRNLFHLLGLRLDPHAQKEIVDFAQAMYDLLKDKLPLSFEAFEDYQRQAKTFSRMELVLIKDLVSNGINDLCTQETITQAGLELGMSKREITEFIEFFNIK